MEEKMSLWSMFIGSGIIARVSPLLKKTKHDVVSSAFSIY